MVRGCSCSNCEDGWYVVRAEIGALADRRLMAPTVWLGADLGYLPDAREFVGWLRARGMPDDPSRAKCKRRGIGAVELVHDRDRGPWTSVMAREGTPDVFILIRDAT